MALCHHLIVHLASERAGIPVRGRYVVLGDDIVIADQHIAKHYVEIMAELDIPISKAKTHVSENSYEFAKR